MYTVDPCGYDSMIFAVGPITGTTFHNGIVGCFMTPVEPGDLAMGDVGPSQVQPCCMEQLLGRVIDPLYKSFKRAAEVGCE